MQRAGDGGAELGADAQNEPSGVVDHPSGLPDDLEAQSLGRQASSNSGGSARRFIATTTLCVSSARRNQAALAPKYLTLFLSDGEQRIDNNHTERSLRPIAVGRKNWLFAGSDQGARRLAILYTMIGSCELAGIRDPWEYVRDILQKLSRCWPHSHLDELLPLAWLNARTNR